MNVKASILVTIGRRPLPRKRSPGFGSDRTSDQKGTPRPPDTDISVDNVANLCCGIYRRIFPSASRFAKFPWLSIIGVTGGHDPVPH